MRYEVFMDTAKVGEAETVETGTRQRRMAFTYDRGWLSRPEAFPISPEMPLASGPHEPFPSRHTPLAFDDAAPDRWGRDLINEGHRRRAKACGQPWRPLDEVGLLLAVNDETRQGALRFQLDGRFLSQPQERARMHELADLRTAAARFEQSGEIDESVEHLIAVGSSPGGAVPKAWVHDETDRMWLAKFPRASDLADVGAWEQVAMVLQRRSGIAVQPSQILRLGKSESVFLAQRFDREGERRLPYQSFKTMFMLDDNARKDYASLSREVTRISENPKADGEQLFARAAFGVMVNNIDDHMRNHGLLRRGPGWRLAPSFDVNPSARGFSDTPLTPEDDPANPDLRLLVERAEDFHMTEDRAAQRLEQVANAVESWADVARETGIDPDAMRLMSQAFDDSHRRTAKRISHAKGTSQNGGQRSVSGQVWTKPHVRQGHHVDGHWRRGPNT